MSELVKLEKRFEDAMEKLELALSNKVIRERVSDSSIKKEDLGKQSHNNIENLLEKIEHLEKAAENDAKEIDKLVVKLKEILETEND